MHTIHRFFWKSVAVGLLAVVALPLVASADLYSGPARNTSNFKLDNPFKGIDSLEGLVTAILKSLTVLGGIVSVLFFVYSGFLYVMAVGNKDKLEKAHAAFKYTVIGTALLVTASTLATILQRTISSVVK